MTAQPHEPGTMPFGVHDSEEPMAREDVIQRFKVIGATDNEANGLADSNDESYVASVSNQDLTGKLDAYRLAGGIDLDNLTVPKVKEWVGDDPDRAKVVADLEAQRDKTRAGVMAHVETVAPEAVAGNAEQVDAGDPPAEPISSEPIAPAPVEQSDPSADPQASEAVVNESGQATDAQGDTADPQAQAAEATVEPQPGQ